MPTESLEDKFATLFHPSTPRASPTSEHASLPLSLSDPIPFEMHSEPSTARPILRSAPQQQNRLSLAHSLSSNDSFGSFVSVRPDEDPLASSSFGSFAEGGPASRAVHDVVAVGVGNQEVANPLEDPNPTLRFFDHYAQQAKQANEARGREVLGELMRYEEEGELFLGEGATGEGGAGLGGEGGGAAGFGLGETADANDGDASHDVGQAEEQVAQLGGTGKVQDPLIPLPPNPPHQPRHPELPHSQFSLDDIDSSYFSPPIKGSPSPILPSTTPQPHVSPRHATPLHHLPESHSHSHPRFTPGSPSSPRLLSTPQPRPIAAPTHITASPIPSSSTPIPSSSNLSSSSTLPPTSSSSLSPATQRQRAASEDREPRPDIPKRSSSYQTLSSISAKWIPSLFSVKPPPEKERRGVQDIFPSPHPPPHHPTQHTPPHSHTQPFPPSASQSQHAATQPRHGSIPVYPTEEITHSSSPFASHTSTFAPIAGAPGFRPEYDWDAGYSGELEREVLGAGGSGLKKGVASSNGNGNGVERGREKPIREQVPGSGRVEALTKAAAKEVKGGEKIVEVIERRAGSVELVGRKESTVGVLTPWLADSIRPHLPALARLPRIWTLLYSLDQHGISINTLYARCEAHLSNIKILSKGMLVIMRDSGDGVFGCWIGEGVKMSRGRGYSGGGESFLFRVESGERVKVWKWTGRNDYVALCENEYLSFGGGDGHYGLYLDSSLYDGSSAPCPTFGNEPLCTPGPRKAGTVEFECVGLEVWGLGS